MPLPRRIAVETSSSLVDEVGTPKLFLFSIRRVSIGKSVESPEFCFVRSWLANILRAFLVLVRHACSGGRAKNIRG